MARPYEDLEAAQSPEERRQVREQVRLYLGEIMLREVRGDRSAAREVLARVLGVEVADLAALEQQVAIDLAELEAERGPEQYPGTLIDSLEKTVAALGGQVRITAVFPQGEIDVRRVDEPAETKRKTAQTAEPAAAA